MEDLKVSGGRTRRDWDHWACACGTRSLTTFDVCHVCKRRRTTEPTLRILPGERGGEITVRVEAEHPCNGCNAIDQAIVNDAGYCAACSTDEPCGIR